MQADRRDVGLVRAVGAWSFAASITAEIIGAGIFVAPSGLAASVGSYAPLVLLICGIPVGAVAICFAEGGSRIPSSGGAYGYIEACFGPRTGYVAGTLLWVSSVLACAGITAALADVVASLAPRPIAGLVHAVAIVALIAGISAVHLGGISRGMQLVSAATVVKLVPLLLFVIIGAPYVRAANFLHAPPPASADLGHALILATFAFLGMEGPLCASGEVADPSRNIPRALALALGTVTVLYVAIQCVAQGILGPDLARSSTPLADAMATVSPALRALMLAGAALSMFGWLSNNLLCSPRLLFGLARDGLMPAFLGRVSERTHVPHLAILGYAALAIALGLSGTFVELAVLSALASAALYIAGCAAAWKLAQKGVASAGTPLRFRSLRAAMLVGITGMIGMIALASLKEILGLALLMAVSVAVYQLQTRSARTS